MVDSEFKWKILQSLSQEVQNCQTERSISECSTADYLDKLIEACQCLPYKLRSQETKGYEGKVHHMNLIN